MYHKVSETISFMNFEILFQVYDIIKDHPEGLKLNDVSTVLGSPNDKGTVVEFHSPNVAVKENIGQFDVTVCRYGDLRNEVRVRYVENSYCF